MEYLVNALGPVLDFINGLAITISEKFTGGDTGAAMIMVIFYLIGLILILLLLKGIVSVVRDLLRTIFCRPKNKKARVMPTDNGATNSNNESTQTTINNAEDVDNRKRTKKSDDLDLIKSFGNKKHIDDLSLTLDQINKFDNCAVQSQHIANTIPLPPITSENNIVLSEKEKEKITKQVKGKNLNELKNLLKQANKEEAKFDNAVKSADRDLSKAMKERDKLVQQELTAIDQHNNAVDALATLCDELTKSKSDLLEKHSELLDFITNLGAKKVVLLDSIKEFKKEISSVSEKNKDFAALCDKEIKTFVRSFQQKEELLAGFKKNYTVLSESRSKVDEDISALQQKQSKVATDKALHIEFVTTLSAKIKELETLERERLAKEEAERIERERLAKEEAERAERERQEKLEAERLEKERLAKEEAERAERERQEKLEAERLEKERLAKEEAERLEKERLAKEEAERAEREHQEKLEAERLEKERLAKEEAERVERERQERLEAERLEKERFAKEEAERAEREQQERLEAERIEREKEEALKKQELETKDIAPETQDESSDTSKIVPTSLDSDEELNEIKEQIKRQRQNSYSINFDDISPEMLEKMALAEKKKRMSAKKAAKLNGIPADETESNATESNESEIKDKESNSVCDKPAKDEDTAIAQNEVKSQEEDEPQIDHFAKLKQQWAEEEAHQQRWAEEKARREEEHQRRKKELAEKLSGNGFSNNNE